MRGKIGLAQIVACKFVVALYLVDIFTHLLDEEIDATDISEPPRLVLVHLRGALVALIEVALQTCRHLVIAVHIGCVDSTPEIIVAGENTVEIVSCDFKILIGMIVSRFIAEIERLPG